MAAASFQKTICGKFGENKRRLIYIHALYRSFTVGTFTNIFTGLGNNNDLVAQQEGVYKWVSLQENA